MHFDREFRVMYNLFIIVAAFSFIHVSVVLFPFVNIMFVITENRKIDAFHELECLEARKGDGRGKDGTRGNSFRRAKIHHRPSTSAVELFSGHQLLSPIIQHQPGRHTVYCWE